MRRGKEDRMREIWMKAAVCAVLCAAMLLGVCACAQTAYVDNGQDPGSQLNMRALPAADADSLGRFVSGTQVQVLSQEGDWTKVRIGGVEGYMKSEYLSESSGALIDARELRVVVSPYDTPAVVLRDRPSNSYDAVAMLQVGETVYLIGTSGDFCYVQTMASAVGCLKSDELK